MADSSNFKRWFDQAWSDWIQPLGLVIVFGIAYGAYKLDLVGERAAGIILVLAIVLGTLLAGVIPALPLARKGSDRATIWVLVLLALGGAAYPTLRAAYSPAAISTVQLTTEAPKATLETNTTGPYELIVSGRFKQAGTQEATADYVVTVEGDGTDEVAGDIKRSMHHYRTSRRGGTSASLEEKTETVHALKSAKGSTLTVSTNGVDDQLDGGLTVGVRKAGPRREIFWTLGALAILLGLFLDARLAVDIREEDRKVRGPKRDVSYLTAVAAMLLVFSINFPMEATPHSLVKACIGAFLLALVAGGAGGYLLGAFARLATKPKRKR